MSDPITIVNELISVVGTATNAAKIIQSTSSKLQKAEQKNEMADLVGTLADAKVMAAELKLALVDKDQEIRDLKEQLRSKGKVVFQENVIFLQEENGVEGPYCPNCWESDRKLVHLHVHSNGFRECKTCDKRFGFSAEDEARHDAAAREALTRHKRGRNWTTGY